MRKSPSDAPDITDAPDARLARYLLGSALFAGLLLRIWLATQNAGITMDSPLYVNMADSLAHARPATGPAHPGYPALVAIAGAVVPGREWPGRLVSLVAGMALIAVVFGLARRALSPAWASLAAWLVALHPLLAVYSGAVMTEASYLALTYGGLLLLERGAALAGGIGLGLGYAVRLEALVIAPVAALLSTGGRRRALLMLAGVALVVVPHVAYLRWAQGEWSLTTKTVLVRPAFENARQREWRTDAAPAGGNEEPRSLIDRLRWAAPSIARRYFPNLAGHLRQVLRSWPLPLLLLSLAGLAAAPRVWLAPLAPLLLFPLTSVTFEPRFSQLFVPALALLAAQGGAWAVARLRPRLPSVATVVVAAAALGMAWTWAGLPGRLARGFDDGPIPEMREAGAWLRAHGRPGALVMDRKAYVPFFAHMRHVQLPDDDYETLIRFAQASGVDYIVLEEYLIEGLRPQLLPLVQDRAFRLRERRVREAFVTGRVPMHGVAVFEVMPDTSATGAP